MCSVIGIASVHLVFYVYNVTRYWFCLSCILRLSASFGQRSTIAWHHIAGQSCPLWCGATPQRYSRRATLRHGRWLPDFASNASVETKSRDETRHADCIVAASHRSKTGTINPRWTRCGRRFVIYTGTTLQFWYVFPSLCGHVFAVRCCRGRRTRMLVNHQTDCIDIKIQAHILPSVYGHFC